MDCFRCLVVRLWRNGWEAEGVEEVVTNHVRGKDR